jgi:hypothetical protein
MARTRKNSIIVFLYASFALAFASGQEYRVSSVSYEIDGRTQERALADVLDFDFSRVFADRADLDAYVANKTQLIINQRVLQSGSIAVELPPLPDGAELGTPLPVRLVVMVKDTHNIIALPKPQYDSNDGLLLSVRARDYNFLGLMQPLRVDLNYTRDTHGAQDGGVELRFSLPFRMGLYDYEWYTDQALGYSEDQVFSVESSTGANMIIHIGDSKLKFGPSQYYYLNPDNNDDSVFDGWFLKSTVKASYSLPLPVDFGYYDKLTADIDVGISKYWSPTGLDLLDERDGPTLDLKQSLSMGRVDWIGNFRRGVSASADVSETYNFESKALTTETHFEIDGYLPLAGKWLGSSGRIKASWYVDDSDDEAGSPLRGIIDKRIDTNAAIYANLDFPVAVIRFMPDEWLGIDWMKFVDFEQQWSPFVDAALVHDKDTGRWFDPRDGWLSGGLELITFPLSFRSFYVRISDGWDLVNIIKTRKLPGLLEDGELFIGLGMHY